MSNTSQASSAQANTQVANIIHAMESVIVGKPNQVRLALCCFLAQGHLLIEDLPGTGKTTLAHALAIALGKSFSRVQFTSDMLPSDVLGAMIFEQHSGNFVFHPGPVFTDVLLGDEINRATPRTQSALLEAMEERQVTVEGHSKTLHEHFFVIATQNPSNQIGTFELPESQLDRFLIRIEMGYPDADAEKALLAGEDRRSMLNDMKPAVDEAGLSDLISQCRKVHTSATIIEYVQSLLAHSRSHGEFTTGLSPRAGLGMLSAARAWALIDERNYVVPEDIQTIWPYVIGHRLVKKATFTPMSEEEAMALLHEVAVPV